MSDPLASKLRQLGLIDPNITTPYQKMTEALQSASANNLSGSSVTAIDGHTSSKNDEDGQPIQDFDAAAEEIAREADSIISQTHVEYTVAASMRDIVSGREDAEDLLARYRELYLCASSLLAHGRAQDALDLICEFEPYIRRVWIDSVEAGVRPISCYNTLQEDICSYFMDGKPHSVITRGLDRLYLLMAQCHMELGDIRTAHANLLQSIELNPASVDAMLGLEYIESQRCNFQTAEVLLTHVYLSACTTEDIARLYNRWGYHATRTLDFDLAYYCYAYAMMLDKENQTIPSLDAIAALKELGYQNDAEIEFDTTLAGLQRHGYPIGLSDRIIMPALPAVNEALEGGPLPDLASVVACIAQRRTTGKDARDLEQLLSMVTTLPMSMVPFTDYLNRPIMLINSTVGQQISPRRAEPSSGQVGFVANPFIDAHSGLMLDAFASFNVDKKEPLDILAERKHLILDAAPFEHTPILTLRASDYPELDAEMHMQRIAAKTQPSDEVAQTRCYRMVDPLRSFKSPDDIIVILTKEGLRSEAVWMTLTSKTAEGFNARLVSEPFDDFGIKPGDTCAVQIAINAETAHPIAFVSC